MMPAAMRPPRASAGCGAATAATAMVAAAARAVRVLVSLVMAHSFDRFARPYRLNDRSVHFQRQGFAAIMFVLAVSFHFPRECAVNGAFGNGLGPPPRALNFGKTCGGIAARVAAAARARAGAMRFSGGVSSCALQSCTLQSYAAPACAAAA